VAKEMNNPKIELVNVRKTRNGIDILKEINITFISGKRHILLGPSGAGKTTLLRLLNRMEDPSSGKISYEGRDIKDIPVLQLRQKVGMVFQIPVTFEGTVKDNLMVPYRLRLISRHMDETEFEKALGLCGLQTDFLHRRASDLSVGEKQRLNVARALINKPDTLLLDEPTSALDFESAGKLLHSVKELNEVLGLTVIMVTHHQEHARLFGGSIIHIAYGTVVKEEEFLQDSSFPPPLRGRI
jgi:putative ABC transport system ATP-binding protein